MYVNISSIFTTKKAKNMNNHVTYFPAGNYMFKVNNRNNRTRCKIWCLYC